MILTYLGIFVFKIIEDALATLRLIVVSNGKKILGAILQLIVTIIWVILTGTILINFMEDLFKIIAFSFGALCGSYVGSILEEAIALGINNIIVKSNNCKSIINALKIYNINAFTRNDNVIMLIAKRKNSKKIISLIKKFDNKAMIIIEKIKICH